MNYEYGFDPKSRMRHLVWTSHSNRIINNDCDPVTKKREIPWKRATLQWLHQTVYDISMPVEVAQLPKVVESVATGRVFGGNLFRVCMTCLLSVLRWNSGKYRLRLFPK